MKVVVPLAIFACAAPRGEAPADLTDGPEVRIAVGERWIDSARSRTVSRVDAIDADADAATIFADTNGNGRADPSAEPASPCTRAGAHWQCRLSPEQAVVYRLETVTHERAAHLMVLPRHIEPAGIEACVGDISGCRTRWRALPWSVKDVEATGTCVMEPMTLWTRRADGSLRGIELSPPDAIGAAVDVARARDDGIEVNVTSRVETQRQHAWLERGGELWWSSEHAPGAISGEGKALRVLVPGSALTSCAECEVWIALATQHEAGGVLSISESRVELRSAGRL